MTRDVVVIGASMGGVEALRKVVASLPVDFPAALAVVLHLHPNTPSVLPEILSRSGPLRAAHAVDGEKIERGRIYVAPPDRHLLLREGRARITFGPPENGSRPAVDPLFRSAAEDYLGRVVGVVLSGMLDCGSLGLLNIHRRGGLAIVQDPGDALAPDMPKNALELVPEALRVRIDDLGKTLVEACTTPFHQAPAQALEPPGAEKPSVFTCPECGGTLFEHGIARQIRLQCRVGHAFSDAALDVDQAGALEAALWTSLRLLDERSDMAYRLAAKERRAGRNEAAQRFDRRAAEYKAKAERVREALVPVIGTERTS
jgi:two-component system, chemotaxis family, protein-glutamate methylesterase/glutaminase